MNLSSHIHSFNKHSDWTIQSWTTPNMELEDFRALKKGLGRVMLKAMVYSPIRNSYRASFIAT